MLLFIIGVWLDERTVEERKIYQLKKVAISLFKIN